LYKSLGNQYYDYLEKPIIKRKIEFVKWKRCLRHHHRSDPFSF
jgi:hypothetical protein